MNQREHWATKLGLVLAMAGNAVGLGNFLRFPVQAAKYGGGAFMIPYFVSFLLLGIPLMWIEWTIGRYGGSKGHGTTPGMLQVLWKNPIAKYLGVIGFVGPLLIIIYYSYIEAWTLGYSILALLGKFPHAPEGASLENTLKPFMGFLLKFTGLGSNGNFLRPDALAYIFFILTTLLNIWVIARGVSKGIEQLAKIAMPMLFLFAVLLTIRVFTLGSPVTQEYNVWKGFDFLWRPRFDRVLDWKIWLAAAGQIFFTLSVGMGSIHTYASYLKRKDDVVATGLATASTNEFAEVILGASIAIPAAVAFFGVQAAVEIAKGGAFNLGFVSMPAVLTQMPFGAVLGFLWFGLLFFAGITSAVALTQPAVAFFEDEFGVERVKAAIGVGIFIFVAAHIPIFIKGALDELDFWMGNFFITLFALLETIVFVWVFGMENAWKELHLGAEFHLPRVFWFIMKYVTPTMLIGIIVGWLTTEWIPTMKRTGVGIWTARLFILMVLLVGLLLIHIAFRRKASSDGINPEDNN